MTSVNYDPLPQGYSARMQRPRTLSTKLVVMGGVFLLVLLASIGQTLWVAWQFKGSAAAVNESGRLRMQTWRLVATLPKGSSAEIAAQVRGMDESLELLQRGDAGRPLQLPWTVDTRRHFADLQSQWQGLRGAWLTRQVGAERAAAEGAEMVAAVDRMVDAIENELARLTAVLNLWQMALMVIAIGGAVILLYIGFLFVIEPLTRLRVGLGRVERADFGARVEMRSGDEFGEVAAGFNRMAETLQDQYRRLEGGVREKAVRLDEQRARLDALYRLTAFVAQANDLTELAQGFAKQVRAIAGADAVAIRWSDEANQRYLMLAGDCLPVAMTGDEQCILTASCHCGQAEAQAQTRVIAIRADGEGTLGHCAKAGFQTLMSVPVLLHLRVLGEIDLFFRTDAQLDDDARHMLDALASHLASAMESLRAQALEREAAVAEERGLLARELHDSIAQSLSFLKIQVQLLRDAQRRDDADGVERAMVEVDAGVRESTNDVRELLMHFRTRTNAEAFEPALRTTLRKFEHQTALPTHLRIDGHGLPLAPDDQIQVLHVIQEALSNVRKHARAAQVWIAVRANPSWVFEVRDDGVGFDPGDPNTELHVGLGIMRERAARVGATVEIESVRGEGTTVRLSMPMPEVAASAPAPAPALVSA